MEKTKSLGKIENVYFGLGGYQDAMLGITFVLSSKEQCWATSDFKGSWDYNLITPDEHSKWTEEDRSKIFIEVIKLISELLKDAKVYRLEDLKNKPIECTFEGNTLVEWRILKEVL